MTKLPELDDGGRGPVAVAVSIRDEGAGTLRVILDDLRPAGGGAYPSWKTHCFVTWTAIDHDELIEMEFGDDQALGLGRMVLARLAALLAGHEGRSGERPGGR